MLTAQLRKKIRKITTYRPLLIGTLVGDKPLKSQLNLARRSADIIEVRLDTFDHIYDDAPVAIAFAEKLLSNIRRHTKKHILLTIRSYHEMGKRVRKKRWLNDGQRAEILRHIFPYIDLVDLEIRRKIFAKEVTRLAKKARVGVVHSYHEFKSNGRWPTIQRLGLLSKRIGGDFFKLAVRTRDEEELNRFMKRGASLSYPNKILIAMGKPGQLSRLGGYSFGSLATYGHLGRAIAPGQMSVKQLSKAIKEIYSKQ